MENLILFLEVGFRHILEGYDHLLFLAGLIIVAKDFRSLFPVITAFTIAHSTTLILSALGILSLNPTLTETLIAASIAYVGIENLIRKNMQYRWIIAGGFGLIHGAGFSGHLTQLLKSVFGIGNIWSPLIGFNLGIEAGQFAVLLLIYPAIRFVQIKKKQNLIVSYTSFAIVVIGVALVITRIWSY